MISTGVQQCIFQTYNGVVNSTTGTHARARASGSLCGRHSSVHTTHLVGRCGVMSVALISACSELITGRRRLARRGWVQGCRWQVSFLVIGSRAAFKLPQCLGVLTFQGHSSARSELFQSFGWKCGCLVVDRGSVVSLVNGHGCVNNVRCNRLLLDNGLNMLVYMMMNPLSCDGRVHGCSMRCVMGDGATGEAGTFPVELRANLLLVAMVIFIVHNGCNIVRASLSTVEC